MTTDKHCVFAHTPAGTTPPFLNISRQDGLFTVLVRGVDGAMASIELSPEATEALSVALCSDLYRDGAVSPSPVTDEMVSRFLTWRLPEDFRPDCYVSFDPDRAARGTWPTGTNLMHAGHARAMLEHILK